MLSGKPPNSSLCFTDYILYIICSTGSYILYIATTTIFLTQQISSVTFYIFLVESLWSIMTWQKCDHTAEELRFEYSILCVATIQWCSAGTGVSVFSSLSVKIFWCQLCFCCIWKSCTTPPPLKDWKAECCPCGVWPFSGEAPIRPNVQKGKSLYSRTSKGNKTGMMKVAVINFNFAVSWVSKELIQ